MKETAISRLKGNWGNSLTLTVLLIAYVGIFILAEILIWVLTKHYNIEYSYSFDYMFGSRLGRLITIAKSVVFFFVLMPEIYFVRRLYIDVSYGESFVTSRQYIMRNFKKIYSRGVVTSFVLAMLKFFAFVPLALGAYEVYYWGWVCKLDELTSWGLFAFMLSVGFTLVWIGVFIHYCISLSLTKYIMALNPRANIFDACDLSVRLMDGKHVQYIAFIFSFVKFLPLIIFIYPIVFIVPYFQMSYIVFVENIMGNYWQDKFPAMIQGWRKFKRNYN